MTEVLVAHKLYFFTAKDNFEKAVVIEKEVTELYETQIPIDFGLVEDKFQVFLQTLATSIIFSGFTAEAYINYYSSTRLSRREFESLDKLDPVSKWLIIPKLVTGKSLNPGGKAIELLQGLVKTRNKLVHYKTKRISREEQFKKARTDYPNELLAYEKSLSPIWLNDAQNGVEAIKQLMAELQTIDSDIKTQGWNGEEAFSWYAEWSEDT